MRRASAQGHVFNRGAHERRDCERSAESACRSGGEWAEGETGILPSKARISTVTPLWQMSTSGLSERGPAFSGESVPSQQKKADKRTRANSSLQGGS